MAITAANSGNYLSRASSFTASSNWTWARWIYIATGSGGTICCKGDIAFVNPYVRIVDNGTGIQLQAYDGATTTQTSVIAIARATWAYVAVTYASSTHVLTLYVGAQGSNVASQGTITVDLSAFVFVSTAEAIDGDASTITYTLAEEYDRVWSAVLTTTQLDAERVAVSAVLATNLVADTRVAASSSVSDSSGNGHNWTTHGSFTYTNGPLPPTNTTPTTALTIPALPYTVTALDVQDAPTGSTEVNPTCATHQTNEVWFKYTTGAAETLISIMANGHTGLGGYDPSLSIWTGTIGSLTQYTVGTSTGLNRFCTDLAGTYFTVPVTVNTTYYIRLDENATADALDDTLDLSVSSVPIASAAAGDLLITDDSSGFPWMIISGSATTVLGSRALPSGEFGCGLPSGYYCVASGGNGISSTSIAVYNSQLSLIGTVSFGSKVVRAITSNFVDTFYVAARQGAGATTIYTIDTSAVQGGTTWTLADTAHSLYAMAVKRDDSTLYYTGGSDSTVYAYDLNGSSPLADLHAAFPGEIPHGSGDGFCDSSNNVWLGFSTDSSGSNGVIRQISGAGSVLQAWTVVDGTYTLFNRFALSPTDTSLVCWDFNAGGTLGRFQRLNLADQSVLATGGPYEMSGASGGPDTGPFAVSESCPVIIVMLPITQTTPPVPPLTTVSLTPSGTATYPSSTPGTTTYPIRRLRRFRIAYEGHLNIFLRRIEFVLQPGTGLTTGQGSDPTLMFRLSKDGGLTWGREQWMGIGAIGEYTKRAYLNNLGAGRNLVGEISTSDPVQFSLIDCLADLEVGFS